SGGSPSELPIDETGKTAKEAYDTRASELLFSLREFAMSDGIRWCGNEAAFQAVSRRTFYRNGKWCAEPKSGSKGRTDEKGRPVRGYRQRMGHSPDHLDSACIGVEHCRLRGAFPMLVDLPRTPEEAEQPWQDEFDSKNYLRPYSFVR